MYKSLFKYLNKVETNIYLGVYISWLKSFSCPNLLTLLPGCKNIDYRNGSVDKLSVVWGRRKGVKKYGQVNIFVDHVEFILIKM